MNNPLSVSLNSMIFNILHWTNSSNVHPLLQVLGWFPYSSSHIIIEKMTLIVCTFSPLFCNILLACRKYVLWNLLYWYLLCFNKLIYTIITAFHHCHFYWRGHIFHTTYYISFANTIRLIKLTTSYICKLHTW